MYERQAAYRKRQAERIVRIIQCAKDVRHMLRDSDKPTAIKIRKLITEALGDDG